MTDDEPTRLLRGLLSAHTDLDVLPHAGPAGRVMLAAAVAGKGCSDDAVARAASMQVDAVRDIIPTMLDRCLHVPALLTAKANRTPLETTRRRGKSHNLLQIALPTPYHYGQEVKNSSPDVPQDFHRLQSWQQHVVKNLRPSAHLYGICI